VNMSINYSFTNVNKVLIVKASGIQDHLGQVVEYGAEIIRKAAALGCTHAICDETELVYNLGTFDTFESARLFSQKAPAVSKIAIVCKKDQLEDATFWETVAVNRGMHVKVFTSLREAEKWMGHIG
jgi:hypothetical protein